MLPRIHVSPFVLSKKHSAVLFYLKLETKFTYVPIIPAAAIRLKKISLKISALFYLVVFVGVL